MFCIFSEVSLLHIQEGVQPRKMYQQWSVLEEVCWPQYLTAIYLALVISLF